MQKILSDIELLEMLHADHARITAMADHQKLQADCTGYQAHGFNIAMLLVQSVLETRTDAAAENANAREKARNTAMVYSRVEMTNPIEISDAISDLIRKYDGIRNIDMFNVIVGDSQGHMNYDRLNELLGDLRTVIRGFRWINTERQTPAPELTEAPTTEPTQMPTLGLIERFVNALIWCSGSPSFAVDGEARDGWLKICKPLLTAYAGKEQVARWEETEAMAKAKSAPATYTVYDWYYTDPKNGNHMYARTPERVTELQEAGIKVTPVFVAD